MVMKNVRIALAISVLSVLVIASIIVVPGYSSATEYQGTSPLFAPGTSWSLGAGFCGIGTIIKWQWTTSDSLSFHLAYTDDTGTHSLYGFSSSDGYVVTTTAHYGLYWYNNNYFFSASVNYDVEVFGPSLTITTPTDDAYLNSTTISVQGTFDGYADGVLVGHDALHLHKAAIVGTNWGLDNLALSEGQNTILVRSYYLLDYAGTKNQTLDKTIQVILDTVPPDLQILQPTSYSYEQEQVEVSWQCSDESGILTKEVKFDALAWQTVTADSLQTELSNGAHILKIRITDIAGNAAIKDTWFTVDSTLPTVIITAPDVNAKISKDTVTVTWTGLDTLSGIDHYEVQITGGQWVNVGTATSHEFTGLDDRWYSVTVKAVDRSDNEDTATIGFGIYTSIWDQNGPYHGIPLYALVIGIVILAFLGYFLIQRHNKKSSSPPEKEKGD